MNAHILRVFQRMKSVPNRTVSQTPSMDEIVTSEKVIIQLYQTNFFQEILNYFNSRT